MSKRNGSNADPTATLFQKGWANPKHSSSQINGQTASSQVERIVYQRARSQFR